MVFPFLKLGYSQSVTGQEKLAAIEGPCLIVSNHNLHLDQALILKSLPRRVRKQVAIAAAESDIFGNRFRGFWSALVGNAFPFTNSGSGVRGGMENVADIMEHGWNVLMFPEGRLTIAGEMQPFKPGAARIAQATGVSVVPVRIDVVRAGFDAGHWLPNPRARVEIRFGTPLQIAPGTPNDEATRLIESAVRTA